MQTNRPAAIAVLALAAAFLANTGAWPQHTFPAGPVKIIVPTAAGGTADALPRILSDGLSGLWGKPVLIENVAGAGGNIGADQFNRAAPDGHVLLASPPNALAINQSLYKKISYDPRAFEPITILGTSPNVLIVSPKLGAASVSELIAKAKAKPGSISFASQGPGSTGHLTGALFEAMSGVELNHVPYRGTAPAMNDLLGGHVDIMFDNLASSLPHHKAGALTIIAVCSAERLAALPEIPTVSEAALPGFLSVSWFAMVAPPQTPKDTVARIHAAAASALGTPEVRSKYLALGVAPIGSTPVEAAAFLNSERAKWAAVIAKAKLQLE